MNILESNKLIAEFMDVPTLQFGSGYKYSYPKFGDNTLAYPLNLFYMEEIEYHISWDWLMPVVEKIAETGIRLGILEGLQQSLITANIEATYKAVVEFIEWYNLTKH